MTTPADPPHQTSIVVRYSPDADQTTGSTESYKLLEISSELMVEIDRAEAAGHDVRSVHANPINVTVYPPR